MFNFGFKKVGEEEKKGLVSSVFKSVFHKYDLMNNVMSLGVQNLWKRHFIDFIQIQEGGHYLDLAGGSGDISILVLEKAKRENKNITITICDASLEMLETAKARIQNSAVNFVCSFAEELPFNKNEFDSIFISFGIRNFTNLEQSLAKIHYALKPEGNLMVLEFFSDTSNALFFNKVYKQYLLNIIPFLGQKIVGDKQSYRYFGESILQFHSKKTFKNLLQKSNFRFFNRMDGLLGIVGFFHFKK